tara:strand:+ start:358 stop:600 length:243 start_codon:yes stop_codon:yes gene_type:complete
MANFRIVNQAVKKAYHELDIEVVRGYGYIYFDGDDGFDKVASIYSNPTTTDTNWLIQRCIDLIKDRVVDDVPCEPPEYYG